RSWTATFRIATPRDRDPPWFENDRDLEDASGIPASARPIAGLRAVDDVGDSANRPVSRPDDPDGPVAGGEGVGEGVPGGESPAVGAFEVEGAEGGQVGGDLEQEHRGVRLDRTGGGAVGVDERG